MQFTTIAETVANSHLLHPIRIGKNILGEIPETEMHLMAGRVRDKRHPFWGKQENSVN